MPSVNTKKECQLIKHMKILFIFSQNLLFYLSFPISYLFL